jgi:hypothetical protein
MGLATKPEGDQSGPRIGDATFITGAILPVDRGHLAR